MRTIIVLCTLLIIRHLPGIISEIEVNVFLFIAIIGMLLDIFDLINTLDKLFKK